MINTYPNIAGVFYESMADGTGMRAVVFLSGCPHHCPGCHNPQTQNPDFGAPITGDVIDEIVDNISKRRFVKGITLSGGDPLYNSEKTLRFVQELTGKLGGKYSIWLYTGYTWDALETAMQANRHLKTLICDYVDILVDGPFIEALADKTLAFRGSSNQRIIDVQESLRRGEVVLHETDPR